MSALLQLADVSKRYDGADEDVLSGVDLAIKNGDSVAIIGPSGSGKSTLLNIIGTLDRPTAGSVMLGGDDLLVMDDDQLAGVRNERIGFVFQLHHLLPQCNVLENVLVPALVRGDMPAAEKRGRELLDRVGLSHRLSHRPGQLSGGEQQRVAVVRALINEPSLLLADEPTGSLDRAASAALGELLAELNRERHVAIIAVTHASPLAKRMGRVFELRDGRLHAMD